jgi:2-dehydropantoate 2-reductase
LQQFAANCCKIASSRVAVLGIMRVERAALAAASDALYHTGTTARIHCGHLDGRPDAILASYVEQMKAANIDITLTGNMLLDIWKKFVLLSGTSGMTASTRQPLGLIREDADMRALLFKVMHETIAVGRAAGVDLPEDFAAELNRSIAGFPLTMKTSIANDLEAGRPLELDWLAGKVVALGRKYGVPTPAQEARLPKLDETSGPPVQIRPDSLRPL